MYCKQARHYSVVTKLNSTFKSCSIVLCNKEKQIYEPTLFSYGDIVKLNHLKSFTYLSECDVMIMIFNISQRILFEKDLGLVCGMYWVIVIL